MLARTLAAALNALAKSPQFNASKARATARKDPNVDWNATKALNADFNAEVDGSESFVMTDGSMCEWNSSAFSYKARAAR
jgi:hypothetical protein